MNPHRVNNNFAYTGSCLGIEFCFSTHLWIEGVIGLFIGFFESDGWMDGWIFLFYFKTSHELEELAINLSKFEGREIELLTMSPCLWDLL